MIIGPASGFTPRPYQEHAINGGDMRRGPGIMPCFARYRRVLAVLFTGGGKTEIFLSLARRYLESPKTPANKRVLILSHRDELVTQPIERAARFGLSIGREQGLSSCLSSPHRIISSTIQTMRTRVGLYKPDDIGLVICDEGHHAASDSFREVLDYFSDAFVLGVTATPKRLDGVGLAEIFEAVAFNYALEEGVADGWLVPVKPWPVKLEGLDLDKLRARAGDLPPEALGELLSEHAHPVAQHLVRTTGERPTIVFCATVAHAFAQAEALRRYTDARVETVYGGTPKGKGRRRELFDAPVREDIIADFRAGSIRYLVNCATLTEGFDAPNAACVAMVRPTMSQSLLIQAVGRGTRPLAGIVDRPELRDDTAGRIAAIAASAKPDVLVLDYTTTTERLSLVSVADALAGSLTPEERLALAKVELYGDKSVDQAVQEARILAAETSARLAAERAELVATSYEIDPFHPVCVLNMRGLRDNPNEARASEKMAKFLTGRGVDCAEKLSASTARKLQVAILMRDKYRLATFTQAKALQRVGIPSSTTVKMRFDDASALVIELGKNRNIRPKRWDSLPALGGTPK